MLVLATSDDVSRAPTTHWEYYMRDLGRTPPRDVIRTLRQEVGFCCPVRECGSPYLTWHHFDPEWRVEHHHRPEGMIALCRLHADQADNGAFTASQLREFKRDGRARAREVRGRLNWMRQRLLAVVGGNFFYDVSVVLKINDTKLIWFDRDDEGYIQLNFRMPSATGRSRAAIENNFWRVTPAVNEIICPPSGRLVEVKYNNGDKFRVEYLNIESADSLDSRYPRSNTRSWSDSLEFPITAVEVWETAAGTPVQLGPDFSRLGGARFEAGFIQASGGSAFHIEMEANELALLLPQDDKLYIGADISLTDLLDRSREPPRLEGLTFTEYRVRGPVVVYPFGAPNAFNGCRFQNPVEAMLFEVPDKSFKVGVVPMIACRFTECEIEGMAFVGPPEQLATFRHMS